MDANEPLANEKHITPMSMITIQNICSKLLYTEISPYPTVVIVYTAQ